MHQFEVKTNYYGDKVTITVIENEGHFGIEVDGKLLAVVQHNEEWEQVSGEPLPKPVLAELVDAIENYYD